MAVPLTTRLPTGHHDDFDGSRTVAGGHEVTATEHADRHDSGVSAGGRDDSSTTAGGHEVTAADTADRHGDSPPTTTTDKGSYERLLSLRLSQRW